MPLNRRVLDADPLPFAFDPLLMLGDERFRLAPGAAARDGDPERAIRTDAQDVAARAPHANELN